MDESRARRLLPAAVALGAVLPFLPSLRNGFVNLDDEWNIVFNRNYAGLGWAQLKWMFAGSLGHGNYEPLHWLTLGLIHEVSGAAPAGFHATALLLHAGVSVLLFLACRRLLALAAPSTDAFSLDLSAAAGALLFAAHPLRAEPVCWISAQHYPLATLFALLSVLAYLRWREEGGVRAYWVSAGAFGASLLSLPIAITLPVWLLIIDRYPLRRPEDWRELVREKIPFLLLTALGSATWLARVLLLNLPSTRGPLETLVLPWNAVVFCLRQTFVPSGLRPIYEQGRLHAGDASVWLPALAAAGLTAWLWGERRRRPACAATWAAFLAALLPASGVTASAMLPSQPADRYSYLPSLALAALASGALARLGHRRLKTGLAAALAVAICWSFVSWEQARVWRDSQSLWGRALGEGEDGPLVHVGAGYDLAERGRFDEAIPHLKKAVDQDPSHMLPYYTLGWTFLLQGKHADALENFRLALERDHDSAPAWNASGVAFANMRKIKQARECFEQAIKRDPRHAGAHLNLAMVLADAGDTEAAVAQFRESLALRPDFRASQTARALAARLGVSLEP